MSQTAQKLSFWYGFVILILWYIAVFYWPPRSNKKWEMVGRTENVDDTFTEKNLMPSIKYILQWTKPDREPFTFMKSGQDVFVERRCPVNNCYVTWNKTYLSDITYYDAIYFSCYDVRRGCIRLPKKRSIHQKYVFGSPEPAAYYSVYNEKYDGFFNLTSTYKLDSDIFWGYILIRNKLGDVIGPKKVMHWPTIAQMKPIDNELREKLGNKKHAVAWFVSNCHTRSGREKVALQIKQELARYNMTLDIYGACGKKRFPSEKTCWEMLENDYYFYLSFENSISEDYVTEKLLNALQHYTVPIVYGGANYTRFMPDGIYLNARTLTTEELVKQMVDLINNKEKYHEFFRWHNHYTYNQPGDTPETDYYCNFCKKINDVNSMNQASVYKDFSKWWNGWKIGNSELKHV